MCQSVQVWNEDTVLLKVCGFDKYGNPRSLVQKDFNFESSHIHNDQKRLIQCECQVCCVCPQLTVLGPALITLHCLTSSTRNSVMVGTTRRRRPEVSICQFSDMGDSLLVSFKSNNNITLRL